MPDLMTMLKSGGTLVVDELDSSLHTVISGKLIEMFQDPETNPQRSDHLHHTRHQPVRLPEPGRGVAHLQTPATA